MFKKIIKLLGGSALAAIAYHELKPKTPPAFKSLPDFSIFSEGSPKNIQQLAEQHPIDECMDVTTCRGNTPLHLVAEHNSAESIQTLILLLGSNASQYAIQPNNEGMQPAFSLNKNKKLKKEKAEFKKAADILVPMTVSKPTTRLTQLIDLNQVLMRYPEISDDLKYIFKVAVEEINGTRKIINKSSTHDYINLPHSNILKKDYENSCEKVKKMRLVNFIASVFFPFQPELSAKISQWYGAGNCGEIANIVYINAKKKKIHSSCEVYHIENGDHAFNVFGRDLNSDPADPSTWGKNAVIADAWLGEVFLASEITTRLKNYKKISYENHEHAFVEPYNLHFHQLHLKYGYRQ